MKPSGIDWIGDIPKSWKVTRLQTLFDQVKDKNSGTKEKNLLSLSYGKIVKKDIEGAFGLIPESFDTGAVAKVDDHLPEQQLRFYVQKQKTDPEESAIRGIMNYAY